MPANHTNLFESLCAAINRVCSGETNLQIHQTLCLVNGYEFCPSLLSHRILLQRSTNSEKRYKLLDLIKHPKTLGLGMCFNNQDLILVSRNRI